MKNIKNLLRRKITKNFLEKHFEQIEEGCFEAYLITVIDKDDAFYESKLFIENRDGRFCVCRGYYVSSYWIMDIEYIYQLRRLIKLYGIKPKF